MNLAIIITGYKNEAFLPRAIESVLSQTYRDLKLYLINDGSPGNALDIFEDYAKKDSRINVITHENYGKANALNDSLTTFGSDWVFFLDGDDEMLPNCIERKLAFIQENPELEACASLANYIDVNGSIYGKTNNRLFTPKDFQSHRKKGEPIGILFTGSGIRYQTLKEMGGFRDLPPSDDTDFFNRMLFDNRLVLVQHEYLVNYRIHLEQVSRAQFMNSRLNWEWTKDRAKAYFRGQECLERDEFIKQWHQQSILPFRKIRFYSENNYQRARHAYIVNQYPQMMLYLVLACLIWPPTIVSILLNYIFKN